MRSNILQTQEVYFKEIGLLPLKKDDYSFFIGAKRTAYRRGVNTVVCLRTP